LPEAFFLSAFFGVSFFFANFLGRFTVFIGVAFLRPVLFGFADFVLVFFLVAIRAV